MAQQQDRIEEQIKEIRNDKGENMGKKNEKKVTEEENEKGQDKYKTCKDYLKTGKCRFGEKCKFNHKKKMCK